MLYILAVFLLVSNNNNGVISDPSLFFLQLHCNLNVLGLDCLCPQSPAEDDDQSVRLVCSSDKCTLSKMTHPRCFKKLEDLGVTTLKNIKGRAREWSDKERLRVILFRDYITGCKFEKQN